jgi:O-antigen/teichoic acid export membrane protein
MTSVARSALQLFGSRSAGVFIGFLALLVFTREIGVAALGSYFLFQAVLDIVAFVTDIGLKGAVEKRISEGQPAAEVLGTGLAMKLVLLAVAGVTILALRGPLARFIGADLVVLLVFTVVFRELGRLTTFVLRGELRVAHSATVELTRKVTYSVVGVILAVTGFGILAPVYGLLAGYVVMALLGAIQLDTPLGVPSAAAARSLLSYSGYKFVSQLGSLSNSWVDVLVIGAVLSPAAVAAYEIAWKVTSLAKVFSDAIATTAFPRLSEYAGAGAFDQIETAITRLATPSLALVIPVFFGTVVLSDAILGIVFGPSYVTAAAALAVLMTARLSSGLSRLVRRTLQAVDAPELDARGVVLGITLNLALNIVLVPRYGLVGAAMATTVAVLAGEGLSLYYLSQFISIRLQWRVVGWYLVAAGGMATVVWLARRQMVVDTAVELGGLIALGVMTYLTLGLVSSSVRASARDGVSALRRSDT